MKYCPLCGSKNDEYTNSSKINEIRDEIKKSNYYELESKKELERLKVNPPKTERNAKKIKCPECGHENDSDSKFCTECGITFSDSKERLQTSQKNLCPSCEAIVEKDDLFCPECGFKLSNSKESIKNNNENICPKCKAKVEKDDLFCPECGFKLK